MYYLCATSCLFVTTLRASGVLYSLSNAAIIPDWTCQKSSARLSCHPPNSLHRQHTDTTWFTQCHSFRCDVDPSEHFRILLHVPNPVDGCSRSFVHSQHCFTHHDTAIEKPNYRQGIHYWKSCHAR